MTINGGLQETMDYFVAQDRFYRKTRRQMARLRRLRSRIRRDKADCQVRFDAGRVNGRTFGC